MSGPRIVEVGPRDGLQNEATLLPPEIRAELVDRLAACGLTYIETGAFVSPKWVPAMAVSAEVFAAVKRRPGVTYAALTPNLQGFGAALAAKATEVAVFASASESFSLKNINCSIADSLERFVPVMDAASAAGLQVRGYVSCVLGCPYEGAVDPGKVAGVAAALTQAGCYEISLGDTIGVGTAAAARALVLRVSRDIPAAQLAVHVHDTYGQALANIAACLDLGIASIDTSVAGLGGCPYAKGATGNVATEDVVYFLQSQGLARQLDLPGLAQTGGWISSQLARANASRAGRAILSKAGSGAVAAHCEP